MFISREYSTDMANIGLWLSSREHPKTCATVILLDSPAQEVDLALLAAGLWQPYSVSFSVVLYLYLHFATE